MPERDRPGEIYVGGEVNNPGTYPLKDGDSIEDVILAAGRATDNADLSRLRIYVSGDEPERLSQKVNINLAEAWLLQALPGIGETRAQAIIEYRRQNGFFRDTGELVKVEGIGIAIYEKLKHLITVDDSDL